jgi:hypothetical protein
MGVVFFYCNNKVLQAQDYWSLEAEVWQKAARRFSAVSAAIEKESAALTAGAATSWDRLRALYGRIQAIRNLSYSKDAASTRPKDNQTAGDVLKNNAGYRSDITRAFVALACAAGFKADVARVVTRDDKFFHENLLGLYGQFDSEVAVVDVDGRELYFDPATPGCPMGLLRWSATDTTFLRASGEPGRFYTTPLDPPDRSVVKRDFDLRLDKDGGLTGVAVLTCTGQEALGLRLEYLGLSDEETRKSLAEKLTAALPGGRAVVRTVENMANFEDELRIEFDIAIPGVAAPAGGRLILPVVPYKTTWRDSFQHARRIDSVYFPYPCREYDEIDITVPEGMVIETVPGAATTERTFARYALTAERGEGRVLRVRRELTILKNRVPADLYPVLRSFFGQSRTGDDGQVVLGVEKK